MTRFGKFLLHLAILAGLTFSTKILIDPETSYAAIAGCSVLWGFCAAALNITID